MLLFTRVQIFKLLYPPHLHHSLFSLVSCHWWLLTMDSTKYIIKPNQRVVFFTSSQQTYKHCVTCSNIKTFGKIAIFFMVHHARASSRRMACQYMLLKTIILLIINSFEVSSFTTSYCSCNGTKSDFSEPYSAFSQYPFNWKATVVLLHSVLNHSVNLCKTVHRPAATDHL